MTRCPSRPERGSSGGGMERTHGRGVSERGVYLGHTIRPQIFPLPPCQWWYSGQQPGCYAKNPRFESRSSRERVFTKLKFWKFRITTASLIKSMQYHAVVDLNKSMSWLMDSELQYWSILSLLLTRQSWCNGYQPEMAILRIEVRVSIKSNWKTKFNFCKIKIVKKAWSWRKELMELPSWKWKIGGNSSRPWQDRDDSGEDKGRR